MKKYFLMAASALMLASVTVSCDSKFEPDTFLGEIQVSTSYVSIDVNGGSASMDVTTTGAWEIVVDDIPQWLSISQVSGSGNATITFSADATVDGRNCTLKLNAAGQTQYINVIQGLSTVATATCAEVIAGPDSKTYKVTGVCTAIANTSYGNFYMNDGTGEIYIYGTVNASGSYDWSNFGIEVGDEVTVQGPKTTYNGTVELVDATFISVSKSLMKCDSLSVSNVGSDGGKVIAYLTNKGTGLYVDVPEDAQDWLSIVSIAGSQVVFNVAPNTAGPRSATLVFKTKSGGKEYTAETTLSQDGLSGTLDVPFSVSEAIEYCNKIGGESAAQYYIKGKVSKVLYSFSSNYGTATFWISDDGTFNGAEDGKSTSDYAHDFECYSVYYFGNQPWAEGNAQLSVGDEVMIYGNVTLYKSTAETSSKKAYVYSVNSVQTDVNGLGSLDYPFNVAGGIAAANAGCSNNVYVAGTISKVVYEFSAGYGTGTFWISDSGEYAGDASLDFEAYSVYYLGNNPWVEGNSQIAVGDKVTLYGALTVYKGTAETSSKKAYVYSHNGVTE